MGKIYKKNTGLMVVSGKAVGMKNTPTGKEIDISVRVYDRDKKEWNEQIVTAVSNNVSDEVAIGRIVTAIGYQMGLSAMNASSVSAGTSTRSVEDVEVITGFVHKAEYKPEVNEDGTPKLKRDGSPRRPHFDVTIKVPDEEGHNVSHRIKIYNFSRQLRPGEKSEIDKARAMFKNWIGREETPVEATIVTRPGTTSSWESEYNGRIYQNFANDHLGKMSWDFNWQNEALANRGRTENETRQETVRQEPVATEPRTYGAGIKVEDDSYL